MNRFADMTIYGYLLNPETKLFPASPVVMSASIIRKNIADKLVSLAGIVTFLWTFVGGTRHTNNLVQLTHPASGVILDATSIPHVSAGGVSRLD